MRRCGDESGGEFFVEDFSWKGAVGYINVIVLIPLL